MKQMPVLFVGHGSPMNAIEDNRFTSEWALLGKRLPRPDVIVSISAHWFTHGTRVLDAAAPRMIYDMYGFPDALYKVVYDAPGSPHFAGLAKGLLGDSAITDNSWGIDHGTWSVLCRMYPNADIPVFQISVDREADADAHFHTGRQLRALREQGALILGSGNVVHNLSRVNWAMDGGYAWAETFDSYIKTQIQNRTLKGVINYEQAGECASLAFTSADHFAPLLCILGASDDSDRVSVFNDACVLGSLSMTGYLFSS